MRSFVMASVFIAIASLISMLAGFLSNIALARILGAEGSGVVAFGLWFAMTCTTLADFGIAGILLRYIERFSKGLGLGGAQPRILVHLLAGSVAVMSVLILVYAMWFAPDHSSNTELVWGATIALFIAYTYSAVSICAARGLENTAEIAKLTVFGCILQFPGIVIGALLLGPVGGLLGHMLRYLPAALAYFKYAKAPTSEGEPLTKKMRHYGRNTWISSLIGLFIWSRIEFLFLGYFRSATEIGFYAAGLTLTGLIVQLPMQMLVGLIPHLGRHHDEENFEQIELTTQRVTRWLLFFTVPICFGGAAIAVQIIPLLYGEEFRPATTVCAVLLLFAFIQPLTQVASAVVSGRERSGFFVATTPFVAIFSCVLLLAVVPFFGAVGAAFCRAAVHFTWLVVLWIFCVRSLDTQMFTMDTVKILLAGSMCGIAAGFCLWAYPSTLGLIPAVPAGALAYCLTIRLTGALPKSDSEALLYNMPERVPLAVRSIIGIGLQLLVRKSG